MATQQLLQLQPCKQEQRLSQTIQQQKQQASAAIVFPVMAWAGAAAAAAATGRPSSPADRTALYDVHNNNNSSGANDGSQLSSQLSHGHTAAAVAAHASTAAADASWEVRAFAEDSASCSGQWPPRSYACSFCRREFRTAQALGGHMNVHRRERAQANNMAILRSTAQQAAAAATATATAAAAVAAPQQLTAVAGPNGQTQWCLYSPMGVGASPAPASSERAAFFYSSLAPAGALLTMASSAPDGSSQFCASRSSPGPSAPSHAQYSAGIESNNHNHGNKDAAACGMFVNSGVQISSSHRLPPSPMSSPASQGSGSSDSSVITKSGSDHDEAGGGSPPNQRSGCGSVSADSSSFVQKLQLGAFQPYQSSPFAQEAAPLVTQELIQLRPQHHSSSIFSSSMAMRVPMDHDHVGILDLELRLGPA